MCTTPKIEEFRSDDLRHTAGLVALRIRGADIHTVAQLLGHKDLRMAARYQHLSPAFLAQAVQGLDEVFVDVGYRDVTAPKTLSLSAAVTSSQQSGDSYGI